MLLKIHGYHPKKTYKSYFGVDMKLTFKLPTPKDGYSLTNIQITAEKGHYFDVYLGSEFLFYRLV